jgi:hypothetical protein
MVRKHDPNAVNLRLRIDPKLLRKLEQATKHSGRSLNSEITWRLDSSFRDSGEDRVKALADQMTEMRRELDAIKLGAGPLPDEEIERRRQLSIEVVEAARRMAPKMTTEEIEDIRQKITKAIEELKAATPEEVAADKRKGKAS